MICLTSDHSSLILRSSTHGSAASLNFSLLLLPQPLFAVISRNMVLLLSSGSIHSSINSTRGNFLLRCQLWVAGLKTLAHLAAHLLEAGNNPFGALPWLHAQQVHCVDFLKSAALALNDKEVHNEAAEHIGAGKDISVAKVNSARDEGCNCMR